MSKRKVKLQTESYKLKPNAEQREAVQQQHYARLERAGPSPERVKRWKRHNNAKMLETYLREGGRIKQCRTQTTSK